MNRPRKNHFKEASILRAAAELFAEKDFHQVLMEEVAVRARVGKGTLYRYFPTKEDLYVATILEGWDRLREKVEQVLKEGGALQEVLEKLTLQILDYFWQRRPFVTLVYRLEYKPSSKEKTDWQKRREGIVRLVEGVLERGVPKEALSFRDVRLLTELFLGMVRSAILYRREGDTPQTLAPLVVRLFLWGLGGGVEQSWDSSIPMLSGGKNREPKASPV